MAVGIKIVKSFPKLLISRILSAYDGPYLLTESGMAHFL